MARRRLSLGTPGTLTVAEQRLLVSSAEADPLMRQAIEVLTGRDWNDMTFGQRLTAVHQELEKSFGAALLTQAISARIKLKATIAEVTGAVSTEEELERTRNELVVVQGKLSEADRQIEALTLDAASLPPRTRS